MKRPEFPERQYPIFEQIKDLDIKLRIMPTQTDELVMEVTTQDRWDGPTTVKRTIINWRNTIEDSLRELCPDFFKAYDDARKNYRDDEAHLQEQYEQRIEDYRRQEAAYEAAQSANDPTDEPDDPEERANADLG